MGYCESLLIVCSVAVVCPIFKYVLWCKVVSDDINLIDFNIKVVIDNDIEIMLCHINIKLYVIVPITTTRSFQYYLLWKLDQKNNV